VGFDLENVSEGNLLKDAIKQVGAILGDELESITVDRAVLGLFFSGVKLSCGYGGLCFTPIKEIPQAVCCPSSANAMPLSGKLGGRKAMEYLRDIFSGNILKKALGIAVLNALSACCWDRLPEKDYEILMGEDAFDHVEPANYKKAVVVGALAPILKKLLREGSDFKVLEMDPATLKPAELVHYAPADRASVYVPDADLLVITGVTILNDTLADLLSYRKKGAEIIVTGPTASMLPEPFFRRGVTKMAGILVTRPDELLDVIAEGGSGYHFFGKSAERVLINGK
jgi:uncharacterized protein (DUF4213/DUF364 family)